VASAKHLSIIRLRQVAAICRVGRQDTRGVLEIAFILQPFATRDHGHRSPAGLHDRGVLESALGRPRNPFGFRPKARLFDLAASIGVALANIHAFNDGNKRNALLATRAFLFLNGQVLEPKGEDEVLTMVGVADGCIDESGFSAWLKANSTRTRR
jgi:death on curing protein